MENKTITLTITEEDHTLYSFLKNYKNEQIFKNVLTIAVDLYRFSVGNQAMGYGNVSPRMYKQMMKLKSDDELLALKSQNEQELLKWATWFTPDQVDCGVLTTPDELWFVEEDAPLGWITLLSHYNQAINAVLTERKK